MENDKRFLVFGCDKYYPLGGISDLIGSFDTIEEAREAVKEDSSDFWDIYDRIEGEIVE